MVDLQNPYAPPAADIPTSDVPAAASMTETETAFVDASYAQRLGNLIVDSFGVDVLSFVVGAALGITTIYGQFMPTLQTVFIGIPIRIFYYLAFEALWGRTPGKFLTRTRVVSRTGGEPLFGQLVKRTFVRIIPFEPFSFLSGPGWHDRLSKTRVVRVRDR